MKLAENLYAFVWKGNDNNCNTFLFGAVLAGGRHILIDPGHIVTPYLHEPAFEMLTKEIERDGIKIEDIGLIALTHTHPDHVESAGKFKEKSGAMIALHNDDIQMYQRFGLGPVDINLEEGELKLPGSSSAGVEVYRTPGHSPGEVSLYWPAMKALAVGDVIFYHNTGRVDLPGGDPFLLKKSIDMLSQLDVEYLLCGHPYDHPGVIQGKEAVGENFDFVKKNIWF
ncbi:MAG: MBL fold metallo-hydrolase [Dehalococcoidales bacterium]|nr:MBL fold metallo-hydrolase [Dehalococcoidales bacterium]